jgi:hypothetical protein
MQRIEKYLKGSPQIFIVTSISLLLVTIFLVSNLAPKDSSANSIDAISVQIYLMAFLIVFINYARLPKEKRKWQSTLLVLIILLGFLEESEYFHEIRYLKDYVHVRFGPKFMQPYFAELGRPSAHWHSIHNMLEHMIVPWIQNNHFTLLVNKFLTHLLQIFALATLFLSSFWVKLPSSKTMKVFPFFSVVFALNGLLAILHLQVLAPDPKNSWFLGYSQSRTAALLALVLVSVIPLLVLRIASKKKDDWGKRLLQRPALLSVGVTLLAIALIVLLWGQFNLFTFLNPFSIDFALRLIPLLNYMIGAVLLLLLLLVSEARIFNLRGWEYVEIIVAFLKSYPSYVFVAAYGIYAILLAQLIDMHILFSDVEGINFLPEETLEFTGGLALVAAALLIGRQEEKPKRTL